MNVVICSAFLYLHLLSEMCRVYVKGTNKELKEWLQLFRSAHI